MLRKIPKYANPFSKSTNMKFLTPKRKQQFYFTDTFENDKWSQDKMTVFYIIILMISGKIFISKIFFNEYVNSSKSMTKVS